MDRAPGAALRPQFGRARSTECGIGPGKAWEDAVDASYPRSMFAVNWAYVAINVVWVMLWLAAIIVSLLHVKRGVWAILVMVGAFLHLFSSSYYLMRGLGMIPIRVMAETIWVGYLTSILELVGIGAILVGAFMAGRGMLRVPPAPAPGSGSPWAPPEASAPAPQPYPVPAAPAAPTPYPYAAPQQQPYPAQPGPEPRVSGQPAPSQQAPDPHGWPPPMPSSAQPVPSPGVQSPAQSSGPTPPTAPAQPAPRIPDIPDAH